MNSIAVVESGDHAGAIERYYTEDSSMQENAGAPRVGRVLLVAHERGVLARMSHVYSKAVTSVVEGDRVAIHWIFELTEKSGKVHRFDEIALQEWRGDRIFRERFFYEPARPKTAAFLFPSLTWLPGPGCSCPQSRLPHMAHLRKLRAS